MENEKRPRGQPKKPVEELLHTRAVRLSDAQWAKVKAGGMVWLRALIDHAKLPKPKD